MITYNILRLRESGDELIHARAHRTAYQNPSAFFRDIGDFWSRHPNSVCTGMYYLDDRDFTVCLEVLERDGEGFCQ